MLNRILALFFPDRCFICNRIISFCPDEICLCESCRKRLIFLDKIKTCRLCGRPVYGSSSLCETCQAHRHIFDRAVSCLLYAGAARKAVLRYKFRGRRDLCRHFSALMLRIFYHYFKPEDFDCIVCVPLSKLGYKKRGYNQSALLAKRLSAKTGIPFYPHAFCKIKETAAQSSLQHYAERIENVRHAYKLSRDALKLRHKRVLLIDDVLTTGATADALSKLLKHAGAEKVIVLTLASPERNRLEKLSQPDLDEDEF